VDEDKDKEEPRKGDKTFSGTNFVLGNVNSALDLKRKKNGRGFYLVRANKF
jgi:hypothetical protein